MFHIVRIRNTHVYVILVTFDCISQLMNTCFCEFLIITYGLFPFPLAYNGKFDVSNLLEVDGQKNIQYRCVLCGVLKNVCLQ